MSLCPTPPPPTPPPPPPPHTPIHCLVTVGLYLPLPMYSFTICSEPDLEVRCAMHVPPATASRFALLLLPAPAPAPAPACCHPPMPHPPFSPLTQLPSSPPLPQEPLKTLPCPRCPTPAARPCTALWSKTACILRPRGGRICHRVPFNFDGYAACILSSPWYQIYLSPTGLWFLPDVLGTSTPTPEHENSSPALAYSTLAAM